MGRFLLLALLGGAALTAQGYALPADQLSVTGKWTGHIEVDQHLLPVPKGVAERTQLAQGVANSKVVVFKMELFKGGKYKMSIVRPGFRDQLDEGTWKVKGDKLDRTLLKSNGRSNGPFTAHYRIEKGGKRLIGIPTFDKFARTIFTRG